MNKKVILLLLCGLCIFSFGCTHDGASLDAPSTYNGDKMTLDVIEKYYHSIYSPYLTSSIPSADEVQSNSSHFTLHEIDENYSLSEHDVNGYADVTLVFVYKRANNDIFVIDYSYFLLTNHGTQKFIAQLEEGDTISAAELKDKGIPIISPYPPNSPNDLYADFLIEGKIHHLELEKEKDGVRILDIQKYKGSMQDNGDIKESISTDTSFISMKFPELSEVESARYYRKENGL